MFFRNFVVVISCLTTYAVTSWAQISPATFDGMRWRQIGPFRGGRASAVAGVSQQPNVYYFGAAAGGVWKTTDSGSTWNPVFDHQSISSIGAIAVAPSNPNVVYVGTGEACIRGNVSYGDGIYKSLDGGTTWKHVGLRDSRHIGRISIHPQNPDIVFVAALGHAYGPNQERGIYRTTDGGATWQRVLYRDENTGGIEIRFDPNNPAILYAALWQVRRTPYSLDSGGPGSGLYKSVDGGDTWTLLAGHGLPDGILGRIGIALSKADSNRIYAMIEAEKGGLYRSENAGQSWSLVNGDERFRQRAWYFSHIAADPNNAEVVYALNTGLFCSRDGGKSFTLLPTHHGDHHALWIDPQDSKRLINANDGGANISTDGGTTWSTSDNQPTAQFYHVSTDSRWPYYVYGAQQDNSTVAIASYDDSGVITNRNWYPVGGGESGYVYPDPADPNVVYADAEYVMTRFDKLTEQAQDISVLPLDVYGHGAGELEHRFQWTAPLLVSMHEPGTLYAAGEAVFRSQDAGRSWQAISQDLTRNDKSKQQPSGGPLTLDITSVEYYDTIFALAESRVQAGTLWAGTDDGLVWITRNNGGTWSNVTPKELPEWSTVSAIEASFNDPATAYLAVDRHKLDDFRPFIYKTTDLGKSWTRIDAGIPDGAYVHCVRQDPHRKELLYAGTELGPFVSFDAGTHWQSLKLNLPPTPISDLSLHDDDLVAATHGRAFWILDDVEPLRQISTDTGNQEIVLYSPRPAMRLHYPEEVHHDAWVGDNPPSGAVIDYYLRSRPQGEITLEILDAGGTPVRRLASRAERNSDQPTEWSNQVIPAETIPATAGMNRFVWDLRYDSPISTPGAFYSGVGPRGPIVLPGKYTVRLTVDGKSHTQSLLVTMDPRVKVAPEALETQFHLETAVRDCISTMHQTINQLRAMHSRLSLLDNWIDADKHPEIHQSVLKLDRRMSAVEEQLIQVHMKSSEGNLRSPGMLNEQFDSFRKSLESADAAPTAQQQYVFRSLKTRLDSSVSQWTTILNQEIPRLAENLREIGFPILKLQAQFLSQENPERQENRR